MRTRRCHTWLDMPHKHVIWAFQVAHAGVRHTLEVEPYEPEEPLLLALDASEGLFIIRKGHHFIFM